MSAASAKVGLWCVIYNGVGGYTVTCQRVPGDWPRVGWFATQRDVNMYADGVSASSGVEQGSSIRIARLLAEQRWDEAVARRRQQSTTEEE